MCCMTKAALQLLHGILVVLVLFIVHFGSAYLQLITAFSALTLLVAQQEVYLAYKIVSGGMLAWLSALGKVQICIWPS